MEFIKADKYIRDEQKKEREEDLRDAKAKLEEWNKTVEAAFKKQLDDQETARTAAREALRAQQAEFDEVFKQLEAENQENDLTAYLDFEWAKMNASLEVEKKGAAMKKQIDAQLTKDRLIQENARLQAQQIGINSAKNLSEAFFQFQLGKARGNQAEELKIRKQMFEVDKAFNVARAVQDGIRSVQAALTIPPPGGQILAAANGILAASNVAKILATSFDPGGNVAGNGSIPQVQANIPNIPTAQTRSQGSTLLDDFGNPISGQQRDEMVIKAYLVERELSQKQKNRNRLEEQTKF